MGHPVYIIKQLIVCLLFNEKYNIIIKFYCRNLKIKAVFSNLSDNKIVSKQPKESSVHVGVSSKPTKSTDYIVQEKQHYTLFSPIKVKFWRQDAKIVYNYKFIWLSKKVRNIVYRSAISVILTKNYFFAYILFSIGYAEKQ